MTPASINHLPIELHTSILKFLLSLSRAVTPVPWTSETIQSGHFSPSENYTHLPSLFPFNVVSVSKLWRDILALIPECWTHVFFDVTKDPTPLLDAFLWSKNLENIEVVVYNSDHAYIVDESRESSRVAAITRALQPHIHRCKSIIFNLSYSTSLPPPTIFFFGGAPRLEVLILDCCTDNIDLQSDVHARTTSGEQRDFSTSVPKLKTLSLTGFWFMYLSLQTNSPLSLDYLEFDYCLSLTISHFKFPRNGCYSLPEFISYISRIKGAGAKYFRDLSLSYAYDTSQQDPYFVYGISGDFHFQSVSKDFLDHLFTTANINMSESLSFEACEIPKIKQVQYAYYLTLTNIIDDDKGRSLRHILKAWDGSELKIYSCHSFNDAFLSWLATEIDYVPLDPDSNYTFPAEDLVYLGIEDCNNFSSHAVKEFIRVRIEAAFAEDITRLKGFVCDLDVTASESGPMLRDEDKRWFEENADNTTVRWSVRDDQGTREVFSVKGLY